MAEMIERSADKPRPMWRRILDFPLVVMVIALVLVILCFAAGMLIAQYVLPAIPGFSQEMKFDLVSIVLVIPMYLLVISRLGRRKHNDYRDPAALTRLGIGLGAGFLIFSFSVGVAALLGVYRITGQGDWSGLLPALIGAALFPAVSEELVFRGILFRWIEEFGGSWLALFVTSAFFGASHLMNPNATPIAAIGIAFEAGAMLGAAYMLTRSLWLPMGLHAAWNFAQGEIWDIPVSGTKVHGIVDARLSGDPLLTGNGFGLEASLICIVIATSFGLWLLWLAVRRGEVMPPMWSARRHEPRQASSPREPSQPTPA